jgi:hypothetical protein
MRRYKIKKSHNRKNLNAIQFKPLILQMRKVKSREKEWVNFQGIMLSERSQSQKVL